MLQKGLEFRLADANFGALGSCAQQNLAGVFVCNVQCDSTGTMRESPFLVSGKKGLSDFRD